MWSWYHSSKLFWDTASPHLICSSYRLSIFGFPGNPSSTNNLALLDQRLAVEWVQTNIANFGGDPTRITLFGQSAGGASVDLYSYAWKSDPIAAGFIVESGNVFSWGLPYSQASSAEVWYNVTSTLGCGTAASNQATVLSCMRKENYNTILQALPPSAGSSLGNFGPTVDDTIVFSNYSQSTPASVPMLIGSNDYEAGLFRTDLALGGVTRSDVFWYDFTLVDFTCPCGIRANASIAANIPTWRYRYFGEFPNLAISPEAGAWHEAETPIIFDTAPAVPGATQAEISIGNYMRGAWAAFAKDPTSGLTTYGWPTYDTSQDTLVRLALNNVTGANLINPYKYDADCIFVNVSDTDTSSWRNYPDLGATVTPTGTSVPSKTGTATGTGATATHTKNAAEKVKNGVWAGVGIGALAAAGVL
jgi:cholinesterase